MPPSAGKNESSSQAGHTLLPKGFKPEKSITIGGLYCTLVNKLEKAEIPPFVKSASAAEPPAPQQGKQASQPKTATQAPTQDTGVRRLAPKRILMNGSAAPAVPPPTVVPRPDTPAVVPNANAGVPGVVPGALPSVVPGAIPGPTPGASSSAAVLDANTAIDAARGRMLENRTTMNRYDVEIQKKFALSAACVVFVLIGAPVALRFPRGGVGLVIGVSLGVFAIYYVGLIAGESLADRAYLTPFWAMWAANVILTGVGLVLLARMGREGATSRGGDMSELTDAVRANFAKLGRRLGFYSERRHRTA
jgi:lipopolysaccharide export system permease protein